MSQRCECGPCIRRSDHKFQIGGIAGNLRRLGILLSQAESIVEIVEGLSPYRPEECRNHAREVRP